MNLLLFDQTERVDDRVILSGRRAQHLLTHLKVSPGKVIRVGQINGGIGRGTIEHINDEGISLRIESLDSCEQSSRIDLIVAMPRPQTLKKVLEICGTMAVRRLLLIGSSRVEKSYFHSPLLQPEQYREHLLLGMEQGMNTFLPDVIIAPRFSEFAQESLPAITASTPMILLADPGAADHLGSDTNRRYLHAAASIAVAIGPEGGWREPELAAFSKHGFSFFRLSSRILRVEQAVLAALAQIELLRS